MDYNLASLRKRVLVDKLDDDEFEPQIIDNFINDTQRDIFNQFELPFQEKMFQGTIPAGSIMFKLPADVAQLQSQSMLGVRGWQNQQMDWRSFIQAYPDAANEEPAEPGAWTLYGGNILLSAPTDKDYTMTIYYIKRPAKLLEDTDVPEIPEEFSELLVLGAFKRVLERNEDYDLSPSIDAQYQAKLEQLVTRYGFREANGPIIMKNRQRRI
jgi:hypothetical protein|nr:MAG TPA: head to tail adaptor [Caudoviricetes sp.]